MKKTPSIAFTLFSTPKNGKPINNEKGMQIREIESRMEIMVKKIESNTFLT